MSKYLFCFLCLSSFLAAGNSIAVTVEAINDIEGGTVNFGVPFPKGTLKGNESLEFSTEKEKLSVSFRVISKWEDGTVRAVFCSLNTTLSAGQTLSGALTWVPGSGEAKPLEQSELTRIEIKDIKAFVKVDPKWICNSGVFGYILPSEENGEYAKYEKRFKSAYEQCVKNVKKGKIEISYYDLAHALYSMALRSGNKEYYLAAHKETKRYIDEELIKEGSLKGQNKSASGNPLPWRGLRVMYIEGLVDDYLVTGDGESLMYAELQANNFVNCIREKDMYVNERNPGWPILELLNFYELTGKKEYREKAEWIINIVLGWQDKASGGWKRVYEDKEECNHPEHRGGSAFMTTILMEGLIRYHMLTGDEKVRIAIIRGNDWLINEMYIPSAKTFKYIQCPEREGSVLSLNTMFFEMLGYASYLSKDGKYDKVTKEVVESTIKSGNYANHVKEFAQAFRSSGRGLYWLVKNNKTTRENN